MVKCVSTYAKKPVVGIAICRPEDTFDEDVGKRIAKYKCDRKVNTKRLKYLHEVADNYYELMHYYMRKYSSMSLKITKAEYECRGLMHERNAIEELYK